MDKRDFKVIQGGETNKNETSSVPATEARPYPGPLAALCARQCITGAVIGVCAVVTTIITRQIECLLLLLLCFYFFAMACMVRRDWDLGEIKQCVVLCTHTITRTRTIQVICRDEEGHIYDFMLPVQKCAFESGYEYIVWIHSRRPRAIMAYQAI